MKTKRVERLEELGQQHQTRKFDRDINNIRKNRGSQYVKARMEISLLKRVLS